jgi:PLP dependent protein
MANLIYGLDAARVAENAARAREEIATAAALAGRDPADVALLAAVKYVPLEELGVLLEAGLTLLGENRAQDLAAKADAWGGRDGVFTWHFIGQLQSRKVKQILPYVSLIHSVASDSALTQLGRHGTPDTEVLIEVNVAGEQAKAGIAPEELGAFIARSQVRVTGLMTMPPFAADPEASRPYFARLRELAAEHRLSQLSMGTSQDFAVAVEEGATIVRLGSTLYA